MTTSLSLLTREGAVVVTFAAILTPAQYAAFYDRVQEAATKAEMKACIDQVAQEMGVGVNVDE